MVNHLYLQAWARCPDVGFAVTGDPALVDALWPSLRAQAGPHTRLSPSMELARLSEASETAILANAEAFAPEMAAAITARRVLVRANNFDQLPLALQDKSPLVLELAADSSPALIRDLMSPAAVPTRGEACSGEAPLTAIVDMLTATGLAGARLDIPACRFAQSLAELGADEAVILQAVFELVVAPRTELSDPPPPPPRDESQPSDNEPEESDEDKDPESPDQPTQEPEESEATPPPIPRSRRASKNRWPGRGGASESSFTRGRMRRVFNWKPATPLALIPTLAAAAPWQPIRRTSQHEKIVLTRDDLRTVDRVSRGGGLAIIVVDASGSMGVGAIRTAKAIALGILNQGYRNRDRVAIVVARGRQAYVGLPPTKSVSRARDCIKGLPTGGGTPLASGLLLAARIAHRFPPERVRTIILSDGAANVGLKATGKEPARADARQAYSQLQTVSDVHVMPLGLGRTARRRGDPMAWLTAPNNRQ